MPYDNRKLRHKELLAKACNESRISLIPFQKKWYYSPEMQGSHSIKAVLPALVPELSYVGLEIADGGSASITYESIHKLEESVVK